MTQHFENKPNEQPLPLAAINEGAKARKDGIKVGDNPYHEESNEHWQWNRGYLDQAFNEKL